MVESVFPAAGEFAGKAIQLRLSKKRGDLYPEGLKVQFKKIDLPSPKNEETYELRIDDHVVIEEYIVDEDYFYRDLSTMIDLKIGWINILLKIPHKGAYWKWMFTFILINISSKNSSKETKLVFKNRIK